MSIHHVTAIAGDFYFGDELGRPGSILTFFPWRGGRAGRHGVAQVGEVRSPPTAPAPPYCRTGGLMAGVDLEFQHRFVPGTDPTAPPLLLLHGTGGNEDDLLPLGEALHPGAPRLSPRGQVLEHGMPRFFRRLAEGVFDLDDLRARSHQLADFVEAARREYGIGAPVAVGFSNGANIAGAMLLLRPGTLRGALLLRPMLPLVPDPLPALEGTPVQIVAGRGDPIVAPAQTEALAELLRRAGAEVRVSWLAGGHGLTREDLEIGHRWLAVAGQGGGGAAGR